MRRKVVGRWRVRPGVRRRRRRRRRREWVKGVVERRERAWKHK